MSGSIGADQAKEEGKTRAVADESAIGQRVQ
jgi:hypothetical protein